MEYLVIAADERLPDLSVVAAVLAAAGGLDATTAAVQARHSWGVFGRGLGEPAAAAMAQKCAAYGIRTLRLEAAAFQRLAAPVKIKKLLFEGERFTWSGAAGEAGTAAAAEVLALCPVPLKEETLRTIKTTEGPSGAEKAIRFGIMSVTGLPIGLGKTKEVKKEVKGSELAFYLDILLRADGRRLRLNPADFDFSCLKEKKTYSSQMNFRVLALELAAFAPGALKNTCLWAMRENKPLAALPYDSMEDFETETRRLAFIGNRQQGPL